MILVKGTGSDDTGQMILAPLVDDARGVGAVPAGRPIDWSNDNKSKDAGQSMLVKLCRSNVPVKMRLAM